MLYSQLHLPHAMLKCALVAIPKLEILGTLAGTAASTTIMVFALVVMEVLVKNVNPQPKVYYLVHMQVIYF